MKMIYLNIRALCDYLFYVYKYRLKFTISIILTLVSLTITFFTIDDAINDVWGWFGLTGTIFGAFMALWDIRELEEDVDSLGIEQHFNEDEIRKITDKSPVSKGGRYYLIDDAICHGIRGGSLKKSVVFTGDFKLHKQAEQQGAINAFTLLSYFRSGKFHSSTSSKSKVPVWNDVKVRLDTVPENFNQIEPISLKKTNYFDYIMAGFFSLRRFSVNGKVERSGSELMEMLPNPDPGLKLCNIKETLTAHHIGISVLLVDKYRNVLYQKNTLSPGKVGFFAPSGSGSLDMEDIDESSFENSLINGAKRELLEETGWDSLNSEAEFKSDKMKWFPLGMSTDLTRGMVTDFYFVAVTNGSIRNYMLEVVNSRHFDTFELDRNSFACLHLSCNPASSSFEFKSGNNENSSFERGLKASAMLEIPLELFENALLDDEPLKKLVFGDVQ